MSAVESMVVFFPRFTTLIGAGTIFATPALDVSRFGGAQIEVWCGTPQTVEFSPGPRPRIYLEESLDGLGWPADASSSYELATDSSRFFSIGFRLRWFRVRFEPRSEVISMWCEGIMRAGGTGSREWLRPAPPPIRVVQDANVGGAEPDHAMVRMPSPGLKDDMDPALRKLLGNL